MLVAKLKGITLAVGTMTAVVSGAVVLAQSGPPGPGPGNNPKPVEVRIGDDGTQGQVRRVPEEKRADRDDRTAALEKKLDRILHALEQLAQPERPSRSRARSSFDADDRPAPEALDTVSVASAVLAPAPTPEPAPVLQPPPASRAPAQLGPPRADMRPPSVPPPPVAPSADTLPPNHPPIGSAPRQASLAERVQALEQKMQSVERAVLQLSEQLSALDARVGGGSGSPTPPADLTPLPAPGPVPR